MVFWVRVNGRIPRDYLPAGSWDLAGYFEEQEWAVEAALVYVETHDVRVDVIESDEYEDPLNAERWGQVIWGPRGRTQHTTEGSWEMPLEHSGVKLPQPINVDREQVVARLLEQLGEETKERELVEAKERQARLGVSQFVTDHEEEIVEYFGRSFSGSWRQVEERLAEMFKDDAFKPSKMRKGRKETDLEKMVRVLAMSADKTIEVQPTSPIYDLL